MQKALCERTEVLWRAAIPLLERLKKRQLSNVLGRSKLFDYGVYVKPKCRQKFWISILFCFRTDWPAREVEDALEEGKTWLASLLLSAENYEEGLEMLLELTNPEAVYYQALVCCFLFIME